MTDRLDWPSQFERTHPKDQEPYPGGFEVSRTRAFDSIVEQLEKWGAVNIRVSTDAPHTKRNPHRPYSDRDPDDPAVVAYCDKDAQGYAFASSQWNSLRDNARAIALYIDAKRAIERYGVATVGAEFQTQALPSGEEDDAVVAMSKPPHEVLGVAPDAPDAVIKAASRELLKENHADHGGDGTLIHDIKNARDAMLE